MGGEIAPWFEIKIEDTGESITFRSEAEAKEFSQIEFTFYQWVAPYQKEQSFKSVADFVFNNIHQTVFGLHNPSQYGPGPHFLENHLNSIYVSNKLPLSSSGAGIFVDDIRRKYGETTALGCLAYITKHMGGVLTDADGTRGVMLAFLREQSISEIALQSTQKNLDKLTGRIFNKINEINDAQATQSDEYTKLIKNQIKRNDIQKRWDIRRLRTALSEQDRKFNSAITEFNDVKLAYQEFMKLKAPVDYWRAKAEQHKASSKAYRNHLIWHGGWMAPVLLLLLSGMAFASYKTADPTKPFVAQFVFVAIGILITTVAFWAARIVVRLYMSEHHLAIDAEERATMAMTYLALIERGAADEKDRALVLAPLFRPTSDGIVKDDAAPEFSPAAIASRYLTPR